MSRHVGKTTSTTLYPSNKLLINFEYACNKHGKCNLIHGAACINRRMKYFPIGTVFVFNLSYNGNMHLPLLNSLYIHNYFKLKLY